MMWLVSVALPCRPLSVAVMALLMLRPLKLQAGRISSSFLRAAFIWQMGASRLTQYGKSIKTGNTRESITFRSTARKLSVGLDATPRT